MGDVTTLPRMGKYELQGELGRGAMGVVYRATDLALHREVALKTMTAPSSDATQTARFLREARTAGSLHHPNIVTIHELGQESGTYFIAMELLEGRNLRELFDSGQLPPIRRRLEIVARICDGLDFAHRAGIVHRDVKPANVFLLENDTVKILDFGIAKIASSTATQTGSLLGTVDYMSPEQVRSVKSLDGRSDVFSAGVILYELLFRRRPFSADDLGAALHRILHQQPPGWSLFDKVLPADLAGVLRQSLDKRREARFQRAGEMATALDRAGAALGGRTGTELEERIEELIQSGVFEKNELNDGVLDLAPHDSTLVLDPPPPAAAPAAAARKSTASSRRAPWLGVGGAVAFLTLASLFAFLMRPATPAPAAEETVAPPSTTSDGGSGAVDLPDPSPGPVAAGSSEVVAASPPNPEIRPVTPVPDTGSTSVSPPASPPEKRPDAGSTPDTETASVAPRREEPAAVVPPARGQVDLRVMPWANIEWIENLESGERVPSDESSPARLDLPVGRYRLSLRNPYATDPLGVDLEVRLDQITVVRRTIPGFDARELARALAARELERSNR